jgi:PAS domain S-box-containing protein
MPAVMICRRSGARSMQKFQDRSIKSKLMLLTVLTSSIVLMLAGLASITYHLIKVRQNLTYNLSTLAAVIGANSTAALTFNDPKGGEETLAALAASPHVIAAAIYTKEGAVFSRYVGGDLKKKFDPPPLEEAGSRFEGNALILFRPVFLGEERIGTVYLQSDLEDLYSSLRQYTLVTAGLIIAASSVALLLASRFQRVVSEPIFHLVETAKAISDRKDYTIRAAKRGEDELGVLVRGFNEMLDEIQDRDAALRASEQRFRTLTSHAPVGIFQNDLEGNCLFVNERWCDMTGMTPEEARGAGWARALHPDDREWIFQEWSDAVKAEETFAAEYRFRSRQGKVLWIYGSAIPLRSDAGAVVGYIGTATDITERKEGEEKLKESESRFRQLAENIHQVFWMSDPVKSEILYISPAYEKIWGRSCESLCRAPKSFVEAIDPDDRETVVAALAQQARGEHSDIIYRVVRPDGSSRWIRDRSFPIKDRSGRVYRVAGIAEDITQQREAEEELKKKTVQAQEASRIKSDFVSNVSHELRTPLNAIIGYNALLLEELYGAVPPSQREPLEGIRRNANDLLSLVNDVLDLSRIESGKMHFNVGRVDLPSLIQEVLSGMQPLFEKKSLFVRFHPPERFPALQSDPEKIKQIVINFLSNAVKFTKEGGIVVSIEDLPARRGIEISVRDTGIGIKPAELPKIFEAFHQVDASATREFGGVGLGLAIVKELTHLLQGEVRVESEYGKGSAFTLFLPYRHEPAGDASPDRT